MGKDPYQAGLTPDNLYYAKCNVEGRLVVILDGRVAERGLVLIAPRTRAVCRHQVHELIFTTDPQAAPGRTVDPVSYLGFVEIEAGGVIGAGDAVYLGGALVGRVAGFDETHCPNHLNIVIGADHGRTGRELGALLGSRLRFRQG